MRVLGIVQARMSSTRLPGKVLLPLAGRPVLDHVLERLDACTTLHDVVVATSNQSSDDPLEQWCLERGTAVFRGSLDDVLDRYYQCARSYGANVVVRITADCPAIDPTVVDEVVLGFKNGRYDLFYLGGEFPDGLDVSVFSFASIKKAWHEAKLLSEREHVSPYLLNHPELFRIGYIEKFKGQAHHRWTLDEPEDLLFLQAVFESLEQGNRQTFVAEDILELLVREPNLMKINQGIVRNEGLIKSLANDGDLV